MKKDHKLMGLMIPVIFILCIGLYGIPGAVGSQSDPNQITSVAYNGDSNTASINDTVSSEQSGGNTDQTSSSQVTTTRRTTSTSASSSSSSATDTTPATQTETPQTPTTPETPQDNSGSNEPGY